MLVCHIYGVDYKFNDDFLLGMLAQYDWMNQKGDVEDFSISGHGFMAGPYVVARLYENLYVDGRAAWGRSENKISPFNTYTDDFDTTRWLIKGQLTGSFHIQNWNVAPHLAVIYFEEDQKAYVDANGTDITGQTVSLGRFTFGPVISTKWMLSNGATVSPHIRFQGIWGFDTAERVDITNGEVTIGHSSSALRALDGGATIAVSNGMSITGDVHWDGIGIDDYSAWGGRLRVNIPF